MATLKCLACGHDNDVGVESCTSCSSSLNLKLCSACEAINASSAARCHSCNAEFRAAPEVAPPLEADAPIHEAPSAEKALPTTWLRAADHARRRSTRFAAALWLVPLLAAGLAYYFYGASQAAPKEAPSAPAPAAAGPKEVTTAPIADLKQAPAAPVARPKPALEPKRMSSAVTHTRATGVDAPMKTTPAAVPAVSAAVPAVSEPAPPMLERRQAHVTHTRAAIAEAQAGAVPAGPVPAAAAVGASVPPEKRSDESAGCAPSVAALGLCKSK